MLFRPVAEVRCNNAIIVADSREAEHARPSITNIECLRRHPRRDYILNSKSIQNSRMFMRWYEMNPQFYHIVMALGIVG